MEKTTGSRNDEIKILRKQGWTLDKIGKKYNITRERVRQITPGLFHREVNRHPMNKCLNCGKDIYFPRKTCSRKCQRDMTTRKTAEKWTRVCPICGKNFIVGPSNRRRRGGMEGWKRYCSRKCFDSRCVYADMLKDFTEYCKKNPTLRFWQALRSWSKADFIYWQKGHNSTEQDTFYWKNKNN
jgi:predicted nucleic acid-binding Zn ribbon protein